MRGFLAASSPVENVVLPTPVSVPATKYAVLMFFEDGRAYRVDEEMELSVVMLNGGMSTMIAEHARSRRACGPRDTRALRSRSRTVMRGEIDDKLDADHETLLPNLANVRDR